MLVLLLTLAFAQDEIKEVDGGVWMTEAKFRSYVADSRKLPVCMENLDAAIAEGIAANERAIRARDIAAAEFEKADAEAQEMVQTIADLSVRVDDYADRNQRLKAQRNVAWGIAGGFLAASTTATVLALTR
jgi:hypothetical protein